MTVVQGSASLGRVTFTERGPHERGFGAMFSKIAPSLTELEAERLRLHKSRRIRTVIFAVVVAVAMALVGLYYPHPYLFGGVLVVAVLAGFKLLGAAGEAYGQRVRDLVMPAVCSFLGDAHYERKAPGFPVRKFLDHKLVGRYGPQHSRVEDQFTGTYRDCRFALCEAVLNLKAGKSTAQVFKGLLLVVELPQSVNSDVLLVRDYGKLLNKLGSWGKGERVQMDDPGFEKVYEVYSADAAEAHRLLTPSLRASLIELATARKEGAPSACFTGNEFLLALPARKNLFEAGKLSKSLSVIEEDLHGLLEEVTVTHRVIDLLQGERSGRIL